MKFLLSILSLVMFTVGSFGQMNTTFSDWDSDDDGVIERYEFTTKFINDYFNSWDAKDTRGIIEEDFFEESYAGLDTDNDNMLSDEEWLIGYNYFYDNYMIYEDVDFIDIDRDGSVSYNEYYDALYDTQYFSDIDVDADNYISEYELAYFVFNNWDYDDSETLSRSEFNNFDWYYLDI